MQVSIKAAHFYFSVGMRIKRNRPAICRPVSFYHHSGGANPFAAAPVFGVFCVAGGPKGPAEGKADKLQKKRSETDKMQDLCTKSNIIDGIYRKTSFFMRLLGPKRAGRQQEWPQNRVG